MLHLCLRQKGALRSSTLRTYSTKPAGNVPIKLVAELRKLTEVSLSKAREALSASNNDVQAALEWLEKDASVSGAKKAAKLQGRDAKEGLIGTSVLSRGTGAGEGPVRGGVRGAMVELNCETDFVARNELFGKLLADISHTAAFISEHTSTSGDLSDVFQPLPIEVLQDAPLLSHTSTDSLRPAKQTISEAIQELVGKVGEKISLRRALTAVIPSERILAGSAYHLTSYAHGSIRIPGQGRISALLLSNLTGSHDKLNQLFSSQDTSKELFSIQHALARQAVGFPTLTIKPPSWNASEDELASALLAQQFMMYAPSNGANVAEFLQQWSKKHELVSEDMPLPLVPTALAKWTVGESDSAAVLSVLSKEAGAELLPSSTT
ncbi:hypothetical protein QCA50_002258 [Cerrena zonata]|uniref:Elongation factor Ts, mitochondrial n=1 Tax=Cerrena zonata TaxID=2478898 RepID=A0AAW0GN55_9APHY